MTLAFIIHIAVSAIVGLLASLLNGYLTATIAGISLLTGFVAGGLAWNQKNQVQGMIDKNSSVSLWAVLISLFVAIAIYRQFTYLFYFADNQWQTLDIHNIGDLPCHINYIRHFSMGGSIWPQNPLFAQELLRYPFGIDFYSALWDCLGMPLQTQLSLLGFIAAGLIVRQLHLWAGWWGVGAFFFNGGLAGLAWIQTGALQDYQAPLAWRNFFLTLLVPQRGFLWALPAGLYLLRQSFGLFFGDRSSDRRMWLPLGIIWGLFPFFHLHSFVAISLLMGSWGLISRRWQLLLPPLLIAVLPAAAIVLFSTQMFQQTSVLRLQWGWMADQAGIGFFWWKNLGPWLLIAGWLCYEVIRGRLTNFRWYFGVTVGWFLVYTAVMMAPWDWDNVKVLIWPYLALTVLVKKAADARLPAKLQWPIGLILFFTGWISVSASIMPAQWGQRIYLESDLIATEKAIAQTSINAVFAAAPTHNHPLGYWGRLRLHGYKGHLWSHGIQSDSAERALNAIMTGKRGWQEQARKNGVTHIFWGSQERQTYKHRSPHWLQYLPNISPTPDVAVYKL